MISSDSIQAYNSLKRAKQYHQKQGFDPVRKEEMLEVTVEALDYLTNNHDSLLELGAGSGLFISKVIQKSRFENIYVTDGAEKMLDIAKNQLSNESTNLIFDTLDFSEQSWSSKYEEGSFDAITSSMALHHAKDKVELFNEVYHVLKTGGVFVFTDHMAGSSQIIDHLIQIKRAKIKLGMEDINDAMDQVNTFIKEDKAKQDNEGNKCESISQYMDYLNKVGFNDVDCIWRDYWLAVFVAVKK